MYEIITEGHSLFGVNVGYDESVYYQKFTVDDEYDSLEVERGSRLDLNQFKEGWKQGHVKKEQYVGIDLGHGILTGESPVVLKTDGLIGCAAFLLRSKGAGFLAHIRDRSSSTISELETLHNWANQAVITFQAETGSKPEGVTIVYNPGEVPKIDWLESLKPDGLKFTMVIGIEISETIETGSHGTGKEWRYDVST